MVKDQRNGGGPRDLRTAKDLRGLAVDIQQLPFTRGARVVTSIEFVGGTLKRFPHGLGRRLVGYLIVGIRDSAALGYFDDEHDGRHTDMDKFAYITAHGMSPTVDILFF